MTHTTHGKSYLRISIIGLAMFFLSLPHSLAEEIDSGETTWRYIGLMHQASTPCPRPNDATAWQTTRLFGETPNPQLRRFCLYEHPESGNPAALSNLNLARLDPDVMGVAAQGSTLGTVSWQAFQEHFLEQAGQISLPGALPQRIRLAVVDASPTEVASGASGPEDIAATSPHGTALLNMARDLLCTPDEIACRATVASRLAMAWECFSATNPQACRNPQDGGYVGLISELARAIHAEVLHWGTLPGGQRLIFNLSLGWHQQLGGGESQVMNMPAAAQAVYRALEDAVCRGALPIAAAGNRDASPTPQSGPFLPALWETRPAPSVQTCQQLGISTTPTSASYRPLVFSVAGVEASGEALDMTRQEGVARLAAFGDHGVVAFSNSGNPTSMLTGSSVASLVVSAAAAAVWSYFPGMDSFEVMESLYSDAASLGYQADYALATPVPVGLDVRKISVCQSVAGACARYGGCAVPICTAPTSLDLSLVDLRVFDDPTQVPHIDLDLIDETLNPTPACGDETVLYNKTRPVPTDPCPHRQYDGALHHPWTEPQPESIPCPNCFGFYQSPGKYYIEIDDTWNGALTSATLRCGETTYALGLPALRAGDRVRLHNVPEDCLTSYPTFLSFTHRGDRAALSPIRLCQNCR